MIEILTPDEKQAQLKEWEDSAEEKLLQACAYAISEFPDLTCVAYIPSNTSDGIIEKVIQHLHERGWYAERGRKSDVPFTKGYLRIAPLYERDIYEKGRYA